MYQFLLGIFLFFLCNYFCSAQEKLEPDTLPVYVGCSKKQSNDELKTCFQNQLTYELRDFYSLNATEFSNEIKNNPKVIIMFTVTKDGTVKDFSYTEDSNPVISIKILKKLNQIFLDLNKRGKFIKPATYKNHPINLKMRIDLSDDF